MHAENRYLPQLQWASRICDGLVRRNKQLNVQSADTQEFFYLNSQLLLTKKVKANIVSLLYINDLNHGSNTILKDYMDHGSTVVQYSTMTMVQSLS